MLRWAIVWQATWVLLVGGSLDFRHIRTQHLPTYQANCFNYPTLGHTSRKVFTKGLPFRNHAMDLRNIMMPIHPTVAAHSSFPLFNANGFMARRMDRLLPNAEDIVQEHAKLVQDINGLRQVVFVSPLVEENRDYDESIHQETIEVLSTPHPFSIVTSPRPPPKPTKTIPVILLGGASQPNIVKASPVKFTKPISLVGSSVSPLIKHPYPFVMQGTSQRPFKFCMNPMNSMMYTTTRRPGLLQRLFRYLLPNGIVR